MEKEPSLQASYTWWIFISGVKHFMRSGDICFWAVQGHDTIFPGEIERLQALISDVKNMGGISDPNFGADMLLFAEGGDVRFSRATGAGSSILSNAAFTAFLEESSMSTSSNLDNAFQDNRDALMKTVPKMLVTAYLKISDPQSKEARNNVKSTHFLPLVLPSQLISLCALQFFDTVASQD